MSAVRICLLLSLSLTTLLVADMGSIPFKRGVQIVEPRQDAIIAWNGREQLLYLQTTLGASQATKVLEVMPLPGRPTVEASDEQVFKRCALFLAPQKKADSRESDHFGGGPQRPAARIAERKIIGAHDIQIVQLLDSEGFAEWVARNFDKEGEGLHIPQELLAVITEYANDGFQWFLFDTVDVKKEKAKKTPLKIRFKTDHLYYPMRITRTEKGETTVALSVFTNVLFNKEDCVGIPRESIRVLASPRQVPGKRVHWIDPEIFELLGQPLNTRLRSWEISGKIDSFQHDLLIRHPGAQKPVIKSEN